MRGDRSVGGDGLEVKVGEGLRLGRGGSRRVAEAQAAAQVRDQIEIWRHASTHLQDRRVRFERAVEVRYE